MGLTNLIRAVSTPVRQKAARMAVNMLDSGLSKNVVMFRKTVGDNLSQLMGKMVEADHLPGVMVRVPEERLVKELADLQIALNYRMESLGKYFPPSAPRPKNLAPRGSVIAIAKESTSSGAHEGTHLGWERILTNQQKRQWAKTVEKHGQNMFAGEFAFRVHPEVARRNYGPQFESLARVYGTYTARQRAYNESLAFTVQQILSPGMEITAPKGMVREIGRMFHLPNLVRDVGHRFPIRPQPLRGLKSGKINWHTDIEAPSELLRFPKRLEPPKPKKPRKPRKPEYKAARYYDGPKDFEDQAFKTNLKVKVTFPDGMTHYDEVKGLNKGHALWRARDNWPEAIVEPGE